MKTIFDLQVSYKEYSVVVIALLKMIDYICQMVCFLVLIRIHFSCTWYSQIILMEVDLKPQKLAVLSNNWLFCSDAGVDSKLLTPLNSIQL